LLKCVFVSWVDLLLCADVVSQLSGRIARWATNSGNEEVHTESEEAGRERLNLWYHVLPSLPFGDTPERKKILQRVAEQISLNGRYDALTQQENWAWRKLILAPGEFAAVPRLA
jgi:hypothetical protein